MTTRQNLLLLGSLILPVLAACTDPAAPEPAGFFRADVAGALESSYDGTGWFHVSGASPATLSVTSNRTSADGAESFLIYRAGGGQLSPGKYTLEALDPSNSQHHGITAIYTRAAGGVTEGFAAQSGELEIVVSTTDRMEGVFRFNGFRYCARAEGDPAPQGPCSVPAAPIGDAPVVEVTGSFRVTPLNPDSGPGSWR